MSDDRTPPSVTGQTAQARQMAEQVWKRAYRAWFAERSADDSAGALQAGDVAATDVIARAMADALSAASAANGVQVYFDCGCAGHIPSGSVPLTCSLHRDGRAKRIDILTPAPQAETLEQAVQYILKRFKADEAQGYRSRDRQFAIEILDAALRESPASPPAPAREEQASLRHAVHDFLAPYKHGAKPWTQLDEADLVAFIVSL